MSEIEEKLENIEEKLDRFEETVLNKLKKLEDIEALLSERVRSLIEIQQKLIHTSLNAPMPDVPKETAAISKKSSSAKATKISIALIDVDSLKVSGKTFDSKDIIKAHGGYFNGEDKTWTMPIGSFKKFKKALEEKDIMDYEVPDSDKIKAILKKKKESNEGTNAREGVEEMEELETNFEEMSFRD